MVSSACCRWPAFPSATRQESQPDGTTRDIAYVRRQPHPGLNLQEIMATLLGCPPTSKDTPWDAMLRMVARQPQYHGVGTKTVEELFIKHLSTTKAASRAEAKDS